MHFGIQDVFWRYPREMEREPVLKVEQLSLSFRGVRALRDVSFEVAEGSVTALIGPNGAGKTTLFNCLSRLQRPDQGDIFFEGRDLRHVRASRMVGLGVARTFQHVALFPSLTVRENVQVGALAARAAGPSVIGVEDAIELLGLGAESDRAVDSLSLGSRKRVELARALATSPRMLLLDEPAGGLSHTRRLPRCETRSSN